MNDNPSIEDLIKKNKSDENSGITQTQMTINDVDRSFEELQTAKKAAVLGYEYVSLERFPVDMEAVALISKEEAIKAKVIPFYHEEGVVRLGVVDPTSSEMEFVRKKLEKDRYKVKVLMISKSSFSEAKDAYDRLVKQKIQKSDFINLTKSDIEKKSKAFFEKIKSDINSYKSDDPSSLIEELLSAGFSKDSSDIHLEAEKLNIRVRFRIDGVLQDQGELPKDNYKKIVSRIKLLSHLKMNVENAPQDGSFSSFFGDKNVDFRVSVLPGFYGESIVLRILQQNIALDFEYLGIEGRTKEILESSINKKTGLILTTGPTGSGKTTTLYSLLKIINKPGVKAITIENPIEYKLKGITQTPVDEKSGMTFANILRSILRQDPDIVMVGEIRDAETADVATQAALTGHLVLSTLHTNDAVSTIPRLLDLKIKPYILVSAISVVMAQRLVRKLCTDCKYEVNLDNATLQRVIDILKSLSESEIKKLPSKLQFFESKGCDKCNGLGYKGRIGLFEIFYITPEIEKLILRESPVSAIRQQVISDGMITMIQDGIIKSLNGVTDIREVFRVLD